MTKKINKIIVVAILGLMLAIPVLASPNIDSTDKYAWGENIGWINFGSEEGEVEVASNELTGYAWSENVGWISLNCSNDDSCETVDYKVANDGSGNLSGYAWSENVGWINFAPDEESDIYVSISGGEFEGYAWGENVGWISFNCSNDDSCGSVDYKVKTSWAPASRRRDFTPPADVSEVSVTSQTENDSIEVSLSWQNPGDSDLGSIMIYRLEDEADPTLSPIETLSFDVESSYVDAGDTLEIGATYYYVFHTVDRTGNVNRDNTKYAITISAEDDEDVEVIEDSEVSEPSDEPGGATGPSDGPSESASPTTSVPTGEPEESTEDVLGGDDLALAERLAGYMLLRVEAGGAIGYVDPRNLLTYDVRWGTALPLFESRALGIAEVHHDLITPYGSGLPASDFGLEYAGYLFLRAEAGGAITYVDMDGYGHNITFANLMPVFESVALGITEVDFARLPRGYFGE